MAENAATTGAKGGGFWDNFFNKTFTPEMQALIGTIAFFAIIVVTGWIGVNESHRMTDFTSEYDARSIQRGAALFDANCKPCHGAQGQGTPGVAPALNNPDLFNGNRLQALGYAGTVRDFVQLTISAGRPAKSGDWPNPMPTWSQDFGGPLRPDQIRDLTNFVMNWGCQYNEDCVQTDDLTHLPTPAPTATAGPTPTIDPANAPVCPGGEAAGQCDPFENIPVADGDAANGEALYNGEVPVIDNSVLPCKSCHSLDGTTLVGPSFQGINDRVPDQYGSVEEFIYTSILHPSEYIRDGFTDTMPKNFGEKLTDQMLADLIEFIKSH
jgi:mono/diheme cytochrome c family protein/cytochrome c551/c552